MVATPANLHQRFVDGDAHEPCVKARISSKVRQVLERFYERVLHNVLGVFVVASDVVGQEEDFLLVAFDQLVERGLGSALGSGDNVLLIPFRESVGWECPRVL